MIQRHYIKVCTGCGEIIAQCRCDNANPLLLKGICEACQRKITEKENKIVERIKEMCKCGECLKSAIYVYEEFGDLDSAKKYSEKFGLIDLAEYYQKLIDLKATRPE